MNVLRLTIASAMKFSREAHVILGVQESAKSRVVLLEQTYATLNGLSLNQDELFRQALRCSESGLFRAAHVMAWAAFMDFFQEVLSRAQFNKLHTARPNWTFKTVEDLRDAHTEFATIEAARASGLCTKTEMKALHGLLSKRNECAHPSSFYPGLNETLGYVSELFQRIATLRAKTY
jgi:hypothetical protein